MSGRLLRQGRIEVDAYRLLDASETPAAGEHYLVPLERWTAEAESLRASGATLGVLLPNTADVDAVWPLLKDRPLLVLEFPSFGDGRAYSQARLIADRHGFRGELRASGAAVVRDQLGFMARCGFTSFALRDDQDADTCLAAFADFSTVYQPAADAAPTILAQRRH